MTFPTKSLGTFGNGRRLLKGRKSKSIKEKEVRKDATFWNYLLESNSIIKVMRELLGCLSNILLKFSPNFASNVISPSVLKQVDDAIRQLGKVVRGFWLVYAVKVEGLAQTVSLIM